MRIIKKGIIGRPFYFVIRGERLCCMDLEKERHEMKIALSQTGLKPARREREGVNLHQPFQGPVKEYNSHQSVRFQSVYV